ncbi:uncharacterized protein EDB91DRAFT_1117749 [Suillus paluster]|uniref:uncharacterized protein n=1 Tax=Suillus paluster TaxID=48578 RepID=UPI001B85CF8C|nr:uncharacterized protein EDB91DRAFT_1117749 [Suillus paluster]KAG1746578.1 hypothetical protein EDB91DRAFT_1117749 [Suillus paluster]
MLSTNLLLELALCEIKLSAGDFFICKAIRTLDGTKVVGAYVRMLHDVKGKLRHRRRLVGPIVGYRIGTRLITFSM